MEPLDYKDVRWVDCRDFDKFVRQFLPEERASWSVMDSHIDGFHNGSYVEATVKYGREPENEENQNLERWLAGGEYNDEPGDDADEEDRDYYESYGRGNMPGADELLQWLCNKGVISDAKYVIDIWW